MCPSLCLLASTATATTGARAHEEDCSQPAILVLDQTSNACMHEEGIPSTVHATFPHHRPRRPCPKGAAHPREVPSSSMPEWYASLWWKRCGVRWTWYTWFGGHPAVGLLLDVDNVIKYLILHFLPNISDVRAGARWDECLRGGAGEGIFGRSREGGNIREAAHAGGNIRWRRVLLV